MTYIIRRGTVRGEGGYLGCTALWETYWTPNQAAAHRYVDCPFRAMLHAQHFGGRVVRLRLKKHRRAG